jgi:ureidoacrylate peracid hydrolase
LRLAFTSWSLFFVEKTLSGDYSGLLLALAEKVDPRNCALLVIDVQNDFAADGGFFDKVGGDLKPLQEERIPALLELIASAR